MATIAQIETFGARLELSAPADELIEQIIAELPGARAIEGAEPAIRAPDVTVRLRRLEVGFELQAGDVREEYDEPRSAVERAISVLQFATALHAREALFCHAGVVLFEDRLIVLPGRTHAGKSTLTMALVEAGGVYFSDEYAPFAADGRVHAYAKRPSLRPGSPVGTVADLPSAVEPRRCDLVLGCRFEEGASWSVQRLDQGECALLLIDNTVAAQFRPRATARVAARVAGRADGYRATRGEVGEAIGELRRLIDERSPMDRPRDEAPIDRTAVRESL